MDAPRQQAAPTHTVAVDAFGDQATERRAHLFKDAVAFAVPSDGMVYHTEQQALEQAVNPLMDKVSSGQMSPADILRQAHKQLAALVVTP